MFITFRLVLTGGQRQFGVVHLQKLRYALNTERHPSVQFTPVANISNCHLAVVSKNEDICGER